MTTRNGEMKESTGLDSTIMDKIVKRELVSDSEANESDSEDFQEFSSDVVYVPGNQRREPTQAKPKPQTRAR